MEAVSQKHIQEAAVYIKDKCTVAPEIGLILGSGSGRSGRPHYG